MEIDENTLQLLMQVGLLASGRGYATEAETIFNGLKAVRPESDIPLIGMAVNRMNESDFEGAAEMLLNDVLERNPDNDLAKAFLAHALIASGVSDQAREVCEDVLASGNDATAKEMVRAFMEQAGQ